MVPLTGAGRRLFGPVSTRGRQCTPTKLLRKPSSSILNPKSEGISRLQCPSRQDTSQGRDLSSWPVDPTIYALSSAPGRAAIAVIRISGPACLETYRALCPGKQLLKPRVATVRTLYEPGEVRSRDHVLDSAALLIWFPGPRTATGEDVLELHVHGGPATVKAVLGAISTCGQRVSGPIRYAEPGEFTRRAFMNNRLDLTQVEALGDTLSADTEQQRRLATRGTSGQVAKQYEKWRQMLLYARGEMEALIDFSEDQSFDESPGELMRSVALQVSVLRRTLTAHSQNAVRGELLRHGISISLLGAPNAGKSSLLNRIVGREAAIVSNEAGTTRDIVEVGIDIGGYFCRFGDTAGLRQAILSSVQGRTDPLQSSEAFNRIEEEGIRRAKERADDSDLVIVVFSFEDTSGTPPLTTLNLDAEVAAVAQRLISEKNNVVIVLNKSDLILDDTARAEYKRMAKESFPALSEDSVFLLSCTADATGPGQFQSFSEAKKMQSDGTGSEDPGGVQEFLQGLIRQFEKLTAAVIPTSDDSAGSGSPSASAADADLSIWQESLGASERHRVLLDQCVSHLNAFLLEANATADPAGPDISHPAGYKTVNPHENELGEPEPDIVVAAEHLRAAAECLARITGRGEAGDVEEVLGVVFEKFCVGK